METPGGPTRVAIACQGGGSHTAFTAGVLRRLLGAEALAEYEVVGLSGTSGGAVCALLAWAALRDGDRPRAARLLDAFWADNAATAPHEQVANAWAVWTSRLQDVLVTPAVSPYANPFAPAGLAEFRRMLERRVAFGRLAVQPVGSAPLLLVGAVDVLSGAFKTFHSWRDRISAETILASAAIPTLFRAVPIDGRLYWDGLFSQNPPVRDLTDAQPDELWVIQINPRERAAEPTTVAEIADRRNELAGNLSLHQELYFIEKINELLDRGLLEGGGKYRTIVVRRIELARPLDTASKLNRDPRFIAELMAHGAERAGEFLAALAFERAWRRRDPDAVLRCFAADAELVSAAPFPARGPHQGREAIRRFVEEYLAEEVRVDPTKQQVTGAGVSWTVRASRDAPEHRVEGVAEAAFRDGRIRTFRLGAGAPPG
jgi:NTE family protein